MIIDAHAHVFFRFQGLVGAGPTSGLGYGRVLVGTQTQQVLPPLNPDTIHTPEMLVSHMDWAGVDKAVLLQGSFYGGCNGYVLDAVNTYPDRLVGAAFFDPWLDESRKTFDATVRGSGFCALKLEMSEGSGFCGVHPGAALDSPDLAWLWDELESLGMVLVLDLGAVGASGYQTGAVRSLATSHPGLNIVIAHLGQPTPLVESDSDLWGLWEDQIDLGLLPNVWFDTASLPFYVAPEAFPYPTAGRYLKAAIARIGAGKTMWGTDVPCLLMHATYRQLMEFAQIHIEYLPPADRDLIMGGNAARVFGLRHS